MKKHIIITIAFIIMLSAGMICAQETPAGKLSYISFLVGSVDVDTTPDNQKEDFRLAELDMELPQGTIVRTGKNALCEITLYDGSTIKISSGSVFQIESVTYEAETGKKTGKFKLVFGKVRAKVEKLTTTDSKFEISSGTSLAGIRGTSFGVFFDGLKSQVLVFSDSVYLESLIGAFEPLVINAGQFTTVQPDGLAEPVADIPAEMLEEWEQELEKFTKEVAEEIKKVPEKEEVAVKPEKKPEKEGWLEKFLKLNAYVGTITIGNNVYARWIFTPEITIGKLGLGLYLPAIFSPDVGIFGFKDWENHDEWDFTSFTDGLHDFIIKFYYISWGQLGDPLYFKIGSIDNFFLGHGFIVDNYSNMLYFPEVLTIGMQLNIDAERGGIETMVADFSNFQLFGARAYLRPMGRSVPLAFGVTGVHDRPKPDSEAWPSSTEKEEQLPRIIILGADTELPIIKLEQFSIKLYADAAKLGYIYPELEPSLYTEEVKEGLIQFVKGLGTGVGVMGNITKMFTYRLEYRFIMNYYEPGLINPLWANRRLIYPQELLELIKAQKDPNYENTTSAGWLLKGGMTLFKKLEFGLGYENYTTTTGTGEEKVNKGSAYVNLDKGLVPKVYGDFSYNRNANLENVLSAPFDENTLLQTNIFYELAPGIAMAVNYKRTFKYNEETGKYDPIDSFGINTVFSF
ncbi:MAG: FecR family protein [Spirochaetota bacterium]